MIHQKKFSIAMLAMLISSLNIASADVPRTVYVLNNSAETLSKLNLETLTITRDFITVGQIPNQIAVYDDMLYVVNSGTDDIMVIDPQNDRQLVRTIALAEGSNPWFIAFSDDNKAYVTNWLGNTVSVIDLLTNNVIHDINVGTAPQGILIDENMAFVANSGYSGWGIPYAQATISVIDTRSDSVIHTINVPMNAQDVAIDPLGRIHTLCTGDYYSSFGCVAVIDMHSGPNRNTPAVVDTIIIGGSPSDIAITENGKAYCIDWGNETHGYLYSYDALNHTAMHTALNPILVGPNVSRLAYDAVENVLWIPTMNIYGGDGSLQKFDAVSDSIVWKSAVIGSGSYDLAILEPIEGPFIGIDDESDLAGVPAIELAQNYPNPFNPHTRITFTITDEQYLELSVYNQLGQITKNLSAGTIAAGTHVATWDGTNDEGMPVSSGIYFYQLKTYSSVISRRMILLR